MAIIQQMEAAAEPDLTEPQRLLDGGMKLVRLKHQSKVPAGGAGWNEPANFTTRIDDDATGYGLPLAVNGLCSIDPDHYPMAKAGMAGLGFDLDELLAAGVQTRSTRPDSGGRSAFNSAPGLGWVTFTAFDEHNRGVTVLELRAQSPNLQDVVPGLVYAGKNTGELYQQSYVGERRLDNCPTLPPLLLELWREMSNNREAAQHRKKQFIEAVRDAGFTLGEKKKTPPRFLPSLSGTGEQLAFSAPGVRRPFNRKHKVETILDRHGYAQDSASGRYAHPAATGAPGIRLIPGKDDLWQSDHAGDPLSGTFDAWAAHVQLDHGGDVDAAIAAFRSDEANDEDFDELGDFDDSESAAAAYPEALLSAPGLVGQLADHITRSAIIPQPRLSVLNALLAVSALTQNRYAVTGWGTRLNLYGLAIAPTGGGKDHPARQMMAAVEQTSGGQVLSDSASGAGLVRAMSDEPNTLLWKDEVWALLESINSGNGSIHSKDLGSELMKLYSLSGHTLHPKAYADKKARIDPIPHPFLVFSGATTPQRFGEAASDRNVVDGLLNRFLVASAGDIPEETPEPASAALPSTVKEALTRAAMPWPPIKGGKAVKTPTPSEPHLIEIEEGADEVLKEWLSECKGAINRRDALSPLWSRGFENAVKVAGVVAVGVDPRGPVIDHALATWAVLYVRTSLESLAETLDKHMAATEFERRCKKALDIIRRARDFDDATYSSWTRRGEMPKGKLTKLLKLPSRDVDAVVEFLRETQQIAQKESLSGARKVGITVYKARPRT